MKRVNELSNQFGDDFNQATRPAGKQPRRAGF